MTDRTGHVLVVGASSGIGYALAERLSRSAAVTAFARRTERMAPLQALGVDCVGLDVAELDRIEPAIKSAVAARGKLTALVYCAGVQKIKPLRSLSVPDLRAVMDVNLLAPMQCAAAFASRLLTHDDAVFCAVSSIAASRPEPGIVAYASAKAGLEALVKGLAREAAPRRAVAVAPGWLDTEMTQSFGRIYDDAFKEKLATSAPRGIAQVSEIVEAITYLLSPAAAPITGVVLTVDGGASL